jgi:hypothetical protein
MSEYVRITDRKIELTDEAVDALMGDYTPTTEQIRKGLLTGYVSDSEFDRWLAEVKAQVWEEGQDAELERPADEPPRSNPYRGENK